MKRRHARVLAAVFSHPTSGSIGWKEVEALFIELGAEISERQGSRVSVRLFGASGACSTGRTRDRIRTRGRWPAFGNG